jgi:TP53 regulating kinase-like protein
MEEPKGGGAAMELVSQGAEARIYRTTLFGEDAIVKERFAKHYRHPDLDRTLRMRQFGNEMRSIVKCSKLGLRVPTMLWADVPGCRLFLRRIRGVTVKEWLHRHQEDFESPPCKALAKELGRVIARMHSSGLVHGDLTTSNFMVGDEGSDETPALYVLDFGLSYHSTDEEDMAVDLYVLERAMLSTHPKSEQLFVRILKAYRKAATGRDVVKRLTVVRQRGRKKIAFG